MRLSRLGFAASAALVALVLAAPARAELFIAIDKSAQQMTVTVDGTELYVWPVSTGAPGYDTPSGAYKPFRMEKDHFSREWDDAPMPNSIFFTMQGHAIHGSNHVKAIGTPASHGCVRLEPKNAAILWDLVKQQKMANTRVELTGKTPATGTTVARRSTGNQRVNNNDDYDPDYTGSVTTQRQRQARGWQDYPNGEQRYYVDRQRPYYYEPPRRMYRYGGSPFPFGW
jgi:hypothetical protein